MASRASHHRLPQTRWAITSAGSSLEPGRVVMLLMPQPITWPQIAKTSMVPMMAIESMVARGTLRRGFSVSSASGTAASHPVSPCTVRTIASEKPVAVARFPGLNPYVNDRNVNPPGPGSNSPQRLRPNTIRNSIAPTITIARTESAIPR